MKKPAPSNIQHPPKTQGGVALITGMVILLVLTLLAVASMNMGSLQERMTGNLRESTIALNGAESALVSGESYITGQVQSTATTPEAQGSCAPPCKSPLAIWRQDVPEHNVSWIRANGRQSTPLSLPVTAPRYVIESLDISAADLGSSLKTGQGNNTSGPRYFRVTAGSPGQNQITQSLLQSIYVTRY